MGKEAGLLCLALSFGSACLLQTFAGIASLFELLQT